MAMGRWTPYTGDVQSWGIQRLSILHEASGKPRMRQLRLKRARWWWCLAHPVWVSSIWTILGGSNEHPVRDGWTPSYTGQFGPDHAEKHRRMGPGGCLCHFDNAPQDRDSAGAAKAAFSYRHPALNATSLSPSSLCLPLATLQWKKRSRLVYLRDI